MKFKSDFILFFQFPFLFLHSFRLFAYAISAQQCCEQEMRCFGYVGQARIDLADHRRCKLGVGRYFRV